MRIKTVFESVTYVGGVLCRDVADAMMIVDVVEAIEAGEADDPLHRDDGVEFFVFV